MRPSQKSVKCIDWARMVVDLERCGMSQREISGHCGYPDMDRANGGGKYWVNRLKNIPGTQPDFHEGLMLLGLWVDKTGRPAGDVPRSEYRYVRNAMGRITALPIIDRPIPCADPGAEDCGVDSRRGLVSS